MEVWEMRNKSEHEALVSNRENEENIHSVAVGKPHITIRESHSDVEGDNEGCVTDASSRERNLIYIPRRRSSAFPPSDMVGIRADVDTDDTRVRFGHNRYATRKTAAQGMMDMALLLANASQLKSVVQQGHNHPNYGVLMGLISMSIGLQILTGFVLLVVGARESRTHDYEEKSNEKTNKLNNVSVALVFLITVVNIFITSFGIHGYSPLPTSSGSGTGALSSAGFRTNNT